MNLPRRSILQGLAAGAVAGCAHREPVLSVNLAEVANPAPEVSRLETAFDEARRMTVPVYLDNKGPFGFVVDTGANRTVVGLDTAKRCGLPASGEASVHGIAGAQSAPLARVRRLRVGGVQSRGLDLPVLPQVSLGADGLLGIDVLKDRNIRMNFRGNAFEIAPSGRGAAVGRGHDTRIPDRGQVVVPAQYRAGQLVIFDADVGGIPVRAFLDSGSQVTCGNDALRAALLAARSDLAGRMVATHLISATGQSAEAVFATLPRLRLGGVALHNVRAAFAQLHIFDLWGLQDRPAMLVGIDVLRQFDEISLDFGRREVTFVRARPTRA